MKRLAVIVALLIGFAIIPKIDASGRLPVTGTVTLANCIELDAADVSCEMQYYLQGIYLSGLYVGDFVVLTCEPNARVFATSVACDAKISAGASIGDKLLIGQGDRVSFSDCLAQSVIQWPTFEDKRMLPFIRVDCELAGLTPSITGGEQPWEPDVAPSNPDDIAWPPITSGYQLHPSECSASEDGSFVCVPSEPADMFLLPEEPRLAVGDRVAISIATADNLSIDFVPIDPSGPAADEGAYAGDQITFTNCTESLTDGWVYMRTVYCDVGSIEPGPRPR